MIEKLTPAEYNEIAISTSNATASKIQRMATDAVGVLSVVPGTGISVDNTDPTNPIVAATGIFDDGSTPITVNAVTTAALPAYTYNNGAAGVGATLTGNANGAFPTINTITAGVGKTYLVWSETGASRKYNGVYELTTLGTAGTPYVLTRTTTADTTGEMQPQVVFNGAATGTNSRRYFVQTTTTPTLGTSNIIYALNQVGGSQGLAQVLTVNNDANFLDIENLGMLGIGKVPTVELDVVGDVLVTNATNPTGLFIISEAGVTPDNLNIIVGEYGTATIGIDVSQRYIAIAIDPAGGSATDVIHIGGPGGAGDQGFNIDFAGGLGAGNYVLGRIASGGTYINIMDANDTSGSISQKFQSTGSWIAGVAGGATIATIDSTGLLVDDITQLTGAAGVTIHGAGILTDLGGLSAVLAWKLGTAIAGASVLDAATYIEVEIDGTVYKLCIAQ